MLIPADLRRIPSPLLRARLVSHLLDQPSPDTAELAAIIAGAIGELMADGQSVTDIASEIDLDERRVRRLVTRPVAAA